MAEIVKSSVVKGVPQTDIVVRTAIMAAIDDIRANPYLLDFFLQSLLLDELTRKYYGEKELEEVKNWILENEITVTMAHHLNNVKLPHISVEVADASEVQQTLGDINVDASDKISFVLKVPAALVFTPASYDKVTGTIVLPASLSTTNVFTGMRVLDRVNNVAYRIEAVVDAQTFKIPAGVNLNLTRAEVVNSDDLWVVQCESVALSETFNIDCIVQGDPVKTIMLHYLLLFILYRYKQSLFEGRGYENTVIRSSGMTFNSMYGKDATQLLWKRSATVTGFSMMYWPKDITPPIQGVNVAILFPTTTGEPSPATDTGWNTVPDEDQDSLATLGT